MNKKIVGISVALLVLFSVGTMSVFADDPPATPPGYVTLYEYVVEVSYNVQIPIKDRQTGRTVNTKTETRTKPYKFFESSIDRAYAKAIELCTREFGNVASCGAPYITSAPPQLVPANSWAN
ncbi:hypothetical protein FACS189494_04960 [Spirochaetia bacterium]|nr:hypothetical protein FACS189494_04960 [Spirochaetia bacterium]